MRGGRGEVVGTQHVADQLPVVPVAPNRLAAAPGGADRGRRRPIELAVDEAWPWLQLYTGDQMPEGRRRRSLAVEPMTCPPNALADGVDLVVLAPGGEWSGTWTLAWTPGR